RDHMTISEILLRCQSQARSKGAANLPAALEEMRRVKWFPFFRHKVFHVFVLWILAYCGSESDKEDLRAYRDCSALLDSSNSMAEFMRKLGADGHRGGLQ
ncbi:MAG: hypothetical protein ABL958_20490, partial [Bdellovibrionia bacterium]